MHIRCPHCHNAIEVVKDASFRDVECPSCGSHFNLVGGDAPTESGPTKPQILAHFELIEQLGVGHFGTVWKARDTTLDRFVAVKIPRKQQLDESDVESFFREARAAAQLLDGEVIGIWASRFLKVKVKSGLWATEHTLRPQYVYIAKPGTPAAAASAPPVSSSTPASTRTLKRYPISIPLPEGYVRVDRDTPLVPGIKLSASHAKKWDVITLLKVYDDGNIRCAWDSWSNIEREMARDDVIVAVEVLEKLLPSKKPVKRLWTDVTGKFKVEATFVSLKDGKVTLRRSDGKEVSVLVEKLSTEDRKVIVEIADKGTWLDPPASSRSTDTRPSPLRP